MVGLGRRYLYPRALVGLTALGTAVVLLVPQAPIAHAAAPPHQARATVDVDTAACDAAVLPVLDASLAVDKAAAIPGDHLSYRATVTNIGGSASFDGIISAKAGGDSPATIASYYVSLSYQSLTQHHAWIPLGVHQSVASGYTPLFPAPAGAALALTANPEAATSVTYPRSADPIVGTAIGNHATAAWSYHGSVELAPGLERILADPAQADDELQVTVHMEVVPRPSSDHGDERFTDVQTIPNPFQAPDGTPKGCPTPPVPGAPATQCVGSLAPGSYGNVTVPPGHTCDLSSGDRIGHDLVVGRGASLLDAGAAVGHDIVATQPAGIAVYGDDHGHPAVVGHDLRIDGTTGASRATGAAPGTGRPGFDQLCDTRIVHDVAVSGTAAGSAPWMIGDPAVCSHGGLTVGHDLVLSGNHDRVSVDDSTIGHDLRAVGNQPGGVTVDGNDVGHDCSQSGNRPFAGASNVAGHVDACGGTVSSRPAVTPGSALNAEMVFTPPSGAPQTFGPGVVPGLASLAPGASVTVTPSYLVPAPAARSGSDTDASYLARLRSLEGSAMTATLSASGTAPGGTTVTAPAATATTVEHVPIVVITKTGPPSARPGTTATYQLGLGNTGGASASALAVADNLPGGASGTVTGVPAQLAAGGSASPQAVYSIPAGQAGGGLTDTATVRWSDANGNSYGPVSSAYTTQVNPVSATSAAPLATTLVHGNFYAEPPGTQSFVASPGDSPAFSQAFPTVNFNPTPCPSTLGNDAPGYAWGSGDTGQLGTGANSGSTVPAAMSAGALPLGDGFTFVSSATDFAVGLAADGTLWAWGSSAGGQLGTGGGDSNVPAAVSTTAMPAGLRFVAVSVGSDGAGVGHTLALASDGTIWSWGSDNWGQLGVGGSGGSSTPVEVRASLPPGDRFAAVAAGPDQSYAVDSNGSVWGWGDDGQDEMGQPTQSSVPERIPTPSGLRFVQVGAGWDYGMALGEDGSVWAWGAQVGSQLGLAPGGGAPSRATPATLSLRSFSTGGIGDGHGHTVGVASDGSLWGFGYNGDGELGNNSNADSKTAVRVSAPAGKTFLTAVAGASHVVGLAADGSVWTWGGGGDGQLGTGATGTSLTPQQVPAPAGLKGFTAVGSGTDSNESSGLGCRPAVLGGAGLPGPTTRPFTDVTTDVTGAPNGTIPAAGSGHQAGVGSMSSFDAVFTSTMMVNQPGDVTFNIVADDGFMLGFGGGATRVNGAYENAPSSNTTVFNRYPLQGAFNQPGGTTPTLYPVTVHFPAAGQYPYELDYFSCCGPDLSLSMSVAQFTSDTSPFSVYVGYADGLRPAGSIFPFPWDGSSGVIFEGCSDCTFDSGAVRIDNNTSAAMAIDSVTVDVGSTTFDLWPHGITLPAHQILMLAQTGDQNFDSSDFSPTGCGTSDGVLPVVHVTMGGRTRDYTDSGEVLNTHGYDSVCQGNESIAWQRIGGTGPGINVPLPPATTLTLSPPAQSAEVGQARTFTVSAVDLSGRAVADLPVTLGVYGQNTTHLTAATDASGVATFTYTGTKAGTDTLSATSTIDGLQSASNLATVTWTIPNPSGGSGPGTASQAPPAITSLAPADGAVVTAPTPITAVFTPPSGQSMSAWSVTVTPASGGAAAALGSGTGSPPSPLATFDPTRLANGSYTITVTARASGGGTQTSSSTVVVAGNLKLGRYTLAYNDLTVPFGGLSMNVQRTYDSFDKSQGDFGIGWHVGLSNFRITANRELGAGGWSQYDTSCGFICRTGYKSTAPHYVTVTWPDGHQEVFDFTPCCGEDLFNSAIAGFTPQPGTNTTSTLKPVGDTLLEYFGDGNLYPFDWFSGTFVPYNPQRFQLTAKDGTVYVLDTSLGLVSATDRNGNTVTVDSTGVHASNGQSINFTRDGAGRITTITGPSGELLRYAYSSAGDLSSSTDPVGNTTNYSYDANHDLTGYTGSPGHPPRTCTYDSSGRLVSVSDGAGHTIDVKSDVGARQQVVTDPAGQLTTVFTYDALGDAVRRDAIYGGTDHVTTATYDADGHQLSLTNPSGVTSYSTYDPSTGEMATMTDNLGRTGHLAYNQFGELLSTLSPSGATTRFTYDARGNMTSLVGPDGSAVNYAYDSAGNLVSQTDSLGRVTSFGYDPAGHLVSLTGPGSAPVALAYDPSGRVTAVTSPAAGTTQFSYDGDGQITSMVDPLGHRTSFTYSSLGLESAVTDPLGHATQFVYDAAGNLVQEVNAAGGTTSYSYDPDGRVTGVKLADGTQSSATYDGAGHILSMANPTATLSYAYDAVGNITSQTSSSGTVTPEPTVQLTYGHDAVGDVTSVSGPEGTTRYTYDSGGRVSSVTDPSGGVFHLGYDAASNLVSLTRPNGVNDSFTYDRSQSLLSRVSTGPSGQVGSSRYAYDAAGHRGQAANDQGTTSYAYDPAGRLTTATTSSGTSVYSYDSAGNMTARPNSPTGSLSYNAANELLSDATNTYSYDANGELTSTTNRGSGAVTHYAWNAAGQLASVTDPTGGVTSYGYDPLGRRVKVSGPAGSTSYVYDGSDVALEYSGTSTLSAYYVGGRGINAQLEMVRSNPYYYARDGLNSVQQLLNQSGAAVADYSYGPYGAVTGSSSVQNPLGYAGGTQDPTGLVYMRSRYYDPSTGRFLSQDPLMSTNRYAYAGDDPTDMVDPSGQQDMPEEGILLSNIGDAIAAAASAARNVKAGIGCAVGFVGGALGSWVNFGTSAPEDRHWQDIPLAAVEGCIAGVIMSVAPSFLWSILYSTALNAVFGDLNYLIDHRSQPTCPWKLAADTGTADAAGAGNYGADLGIGMDGGGIWDLVGTGAFDLVFNLFASVFTGLEGSQVPDCRG